MKDLLRELYAHMSWANDAVLEGMRDGAVPDAEALRLLSHLVSAEHLWYARIRAEPARMSVWPTLSLAECAAEAAKSGTAYGELLDVADDEGLQRVVRYRNSVGAEYENTVAEILIHVAMHGHYHRGQIARQMRATRHTPAYTDYIGYARRSQ